MALSVLNDSSCADLSMLSCSQLQQACSDHQCDVIRVQPALFGGRTDGKGQSLVYYFTLPIGWQPEQVENKEALGLLQRFVHDGTEAGG